MKTTLFVIAMSSLLCGCAHTLEVVNASDFSRKAYDPSQSGLVVAMEVSGSEPGGEALAEEVALAISKQAGYSVVYPACPDVEADVRLTLHIPKATREGAWQNVVVSWPGSLFFTPAWLGYRYDVTTEVTCDLVSGATGEHLQTLRFPIALVLRHADFGRTWVNCWWAGIFALPNGFYCVTYDTDIDDEMPRDVFPMLGGHMATAIIRAVNSLPWESPNQ